LRILHVIFSLNIGGAETMLVDIVNEQCKTDSVDLFIINNTFNVDLINKIDGKVGVYYLNRKPRSRNPLPIIKLNYFIFKIIPEVIHFHNANGIVLMLFKKFFNTCLTIHSKDYSTFHLKKYRKIFTISETVKLDLLVRCNIVSKVVYNGIPFEQIDNLLENRNLNTFKIVQISRLRHEIKGQDVLIKAIDILVNRFNIKNLHVSFIGTGESIAFLKELVNSFCLEKYVDFIGDMSRSFIYKELKNYQLLVQPSYYEGFGLTVVEAMAAKIPVLVSNIEGPMEIIDNGKYGYYFTKGDPESCSNSINQIINNFTEIENSKLLDSAFNYASKHFNIKITAQNYLEEYKKA